MVLKSPNRFTAQIAIKALQNSYSIDLGLAIPGSFLATLPLLVLFIVVGRRMVAGILDGAFRGDPARGRPPPRDPRHGPRGTR
jgi:cellobiose transport system permease protein